MHTGRMLRLRRYMVRVSPNHQPPAKTSFWFVPQSLYTGRPHTRAATRPPAPPRHLSRPLGTTSVPWDKTTGPNQTAVPDERRWGQVCRALELAHREEDDGSSLYGLSGRHSGACPSRDVLRLADLCGRDVFAVPARRARRRALAGFPPVQLAALSAAMACSAGCCYRVHPRLAGLLD